MSSITCAVRNIAIVASLVVAAARPASGQQWGSSGFTLWTMPGLSLDYGGIVNNSGRVAGFGYTPTGQTQAAMFNPLSGVQFFSVPALATQSFGYAVNNAGDVAGHMHLDPAVPGGYGSNRAFVQEAGGTLTQYGDECDPFPGFGDNSSAQAINDAGTIAGHAMSAACTSSKPFTGSNGLTTAIPGTGFMNPGVVQGINNSGVTTGYAGVYNAAGAYYYTASFIHDGTSLSWIDPVETNPYAHYTIANAISNTGVVTGTTGVNGIYRAFVNSGGSSELLENFGMTSYGNDIDDSGRVVGSLVHGYYGNQAVMWDDGNALYLDALTNNGWFFREARGISDNGRYIAAYGYNSALGYNGAVLLGEVSPTGTVTPEPITMALLGTGLAGIAAARRRRKTA